MTIIVTKPGIIIDVVGSYFYDKKIMTENGLFVLGAPPYLVGPLVAL